MFKIVILEDDHFTRDVIATAIRRDINGIYTMQSARNAAECSELADSFEPDLIFADTRLTGLTGVELLREIRQRHPQMLFILTSIYGPYDADVYADLGVMEVIPKPFSVQRAAQALLRATEAIDRVRTVKFEEQQRKQKMKSVIPALEFGFINAIVYAVPHRSSLEYQLQLLGIKDTTGAMATLLLGNSDDAPIERVNWNVRSQFHYDAIREIIASYAPSIVGPVMLGRIQAFVQVDNMERLREIMRKASGEIEALTNAPCRIGIGSVVQDTLQYKRSFEESARALDASNARVVSIDDLPKPSLNFSLRELTDELLDHLCAGQMEKTRETFAQIMHGLQSNFPGDIERQRAHIVEIMAFAQKVALESGVEDGDIDYVITLSKTSDSTLLNAYSVTRLESVCNGIERLRDSHLSDKVRFTRDFIRERYADDLSLELIASYAQLNIHYLSRIFKEEMGVSVMEFLGLTRIQHARGMLETTRMSVKEIGKIVGYSDPNYFSRIFKKYAGVTPTEYRDKV